MLKRLQAESFDNKYMIYTNDFSRKFEIDMYNICENSPYGARIISYHTAYHGKKYDFIDFWLQRDSSKKAVCAFCKYYSTLIICGTPCDIEEVEEFINMISPTNIVCDNTLDFNCNYYKLTGETMLCTEANNIECILDSEYKISKIGSNMQQLRFVYNIIFAENGENAMIPDFENYFLDISHRIRHGTAKVYALTNCCGDIVSTASVLAVSDTAAVIGSVATDFNNRNKGYATAIVKYATEKELLKNRQVYLQREKHIGLYEKIGYEIVGNWAEYRIAEQQQM